MIVYLKEVPFCLIDLHPMQTVSWDPRFWALRLGEMFHVTLLGMGVNMFWMQKEGNWIVLIKLAHGHVFPFNTSQPVDFGSGPGLALAMYQFCIEALRYPWVSISSLVLYLTVRTRIDWSPQRVLRPGSRNEETQGAELEARATRGHSSSWLPAPCHGKRKYIFVIVRHWGSQWCVTTEKRSWKRYLVHYLFFKLKFISKIM